jgi:RNA polymerase sigma-70 factor (family 1)
MSEAHTHLIMDDLQLINAIAQRDKRVFEVLYKKYYQQLFAVAYRYIGHTQIAEEIVHDVFIIIWNKAEQLNIQYSMKSYLFKSVVNTSLNFLKKEKNEHAKQEAYISVQDEATINDEVVEADEILLKNLEHALEMLPEKCRQVMYLSRFGKLKQQEIAMQMDISIKTVKNHLTYGFQKLREHLEKHKQAIITLLMLTNILMR